MFFRNFYLIKYNKTGVKTNWQFYTERWKRVEKRYICPSIKAFIMANNIKIESNKAPEPVGLYPHARKVGDFIYYSGIGPRERGTKKIPGVELDDKGIITSYDIETQCHSVFKNLQYVVEDSGADWKNVIDVTIFLTNMKDDFAIYNKIYAEYFKDNQPCRTTIEIKSLPTPIAIEVKAIAYVGK